MVERRNNSKNRNPSANENEETKESINEDSNSEEEIKLNNTSNQKQKSPFPYPLQKEQLHAYSRYLHGKTPGNFYYREKIPWKTIVIAFLFLLVGTLMLYLGFSELQAGETGNAAERLALGMILFIPGSYHSYLAFMALRGVPGWTYEHLTVFENEDFHNDD